MEPIPFSEAMANATEDELIAVVIGYIDLGRYYVANGRDNPLGLDDDFRTGMKGAPRDNLMLLAETACRMSVEEYTRFKERQGGPT